jgi:hypothetical protein
MRAWMILSALGACALLVGCGSEETPEAAAAAAPPPAAADAPEKASESASTSSQLSINPDYKGG